MSSKDPLCVQIAALGGQGGGVLAEWLAEAARHAGYPGQMTSIPGVAQRTGATTYYFEMYPQAHCSEKPVFCLSPDADGLDLMIAMEPLEATRALENGLITKRTTVLSATSRIYSMVEKSVAGDGAIGSDILFEALEGAAKNVALLDLDTISAKAGGPGNAAMFGAIAGSQILPMTEQDYQAAIRIKGVAVEASLEDFAAGYKRARAPKPVEPASTSLHFDKVPAGFENEIAALPEMMRELAAHACANLLDYQNEAYVRLFLSRLKPFADAAGDLIIEVVRRLGSWMAYEDVIRVAQLKTRPGRLARIRGEIGIDQEAPLQVTEFLKPGREEFASLMPFAIGERMMKKHSSRSTFGMALRLPTTTVFGFGVLKVLAGLRWWRPRTYRYQYEQKAIECWLGAVEEAMKIAPELSFATTELAVLARGYGGVRARGMEKLDELFTNWSDKLANDPVALKIEVEKILNQARHDPDRECGKQG
ncbi:MAG: indolepyruvate oxidoreductase subunit beta family protein [Rhodospirillaceae bacterium]|nr:indolepyruvate oxidoreductase subunit beta family protein [Rhodospirillaceae bacterium]